MNKNRFSLFDGRTDYQIAEALPVNTIIGGGNGSNDDSGSDTGLLAGVITLGILLAIAIGAFIAFFLYARRK